MMLLADYKLEIKCVCSIYHPIKKFLIIIIAPFLFYFEIEIHRKLQKRNVQGGLMYTLLSYPNGKIEKPAF